MLIFISPCACCTIPHNPLLLVPFCYHSGAHSISTILLSVWVILEFVPHNQMKCRNKYNWASGIHGVQTGHLLSTLFLVALHLADISPFEDWLCSDGGGSAVDYSDFFLWHGHQWDTNYLQNSHERVLIGPVWVLCSSPGYLPMSINLCLYPIFYKELVTGVTTNNFN